MRQLSLIQLAVSSRSLPGKKQGSPLDRPVLFECFCWAFPGKKLLYPRGLLRPRVHIVFCWAHQLSTDRGLRLTSLLLLRTYEEEILCIWVDCGTWYFKNHVIVYSGHNSTSSPSFIKKDPTIKKWHRFWQILLSTKYSQTTWKSSHIASSPSILSR